MNKRIYVLAVGTVLLGFAGIASAQQYPIIDEIAHKVVQKYRNASCETVVAATRPAKITERAGGDPGPAERSANARRLHRSSGRANRQQDVLNAGCCRDHRKKSASNWFGVVRGDFFHPAGRSR